MCNCRRPQRSFPDCGWRSWNEWHPARTRPLSSSAIQWWLMAAETASLRLGTAGFRQEGSWVLIATAAFLSPWKGWRERISCWVWVVVPELANSNAKTSGFEESDPHSGRRHITLPFCISRLHLYINPSSGAPISCWICPLPSNRRSAIFYHRSILQPLLSLQFGIGLGAADVGNGHDVQVLNELLWLFEIP